MLMLAQACSLILRAGAVQVCSVKQREETGSDGCSLVSTALNKGVDTGQEICGHQSQTTGTSTTTTRTIVAANICVAKNLPVQINSANGACGRA
ncbi:hypothetical protein SEVIR_2G227250v4 [Setaria viridis]